MTEVLRAKYLEYLRVLLEKDTALYFDIEDRQYTAEEIAVEIANGTELGMLAGTMMEMQAAMELVSIDEQIALHPPQLN